MKRKDEADIFICVMFFVIAFYISSIMNGCIFVIN